MAISNQLTGCESFSLTKKITDCLSQINNSKYTITGPLCARSLSPITLPIFSLADASIHALFFTGKGIMGAFVSPYNCLAMAFSPKHAAPKEFEFSSALIHLMQVIDNLFNGIVLTVLATLNPDRANAWANRNGNTVGFLLENMELKRANAEKQQLQNQITQLTEQNNLNNRSIRLLNEQINHCSQRIANQTKREENFSRELQNKNQMIENLANTLRTSEILKTRYLEEKNGIIEQTNAFRAESIQRNNENLLLFTALQAKLERKKIKWKEKEEDLKKEAGCQAVMYAEVTEEKNKLFQDASIMRNTITQLRQDKEQLERTNNELAKINQSLIGSNILKDSTL